MEVKFSILGIEERIMNKWDRSSKQTKSLLSEYYFYSNNNDGYVFKLFTWNLCPFRVPTNSFISQTLNIMEELFTLQLQHV